VDLHGARIWDNTFYNCNTDDSYPSGAALMNDVQNLTIPITIDFRNNIIWPSAVSGRYAGGETGFAAEGVRITGNRNLWFGGNNRGSAGFDANALFANPLFVNVERNPLDFHIQPASPAIASGDVAVVPVVSSNYDCDLIPAGASNINRGAY
jgi:hypothetical protein